MTPKKITYKQKFIIPFLSLYFASSCAYIMLRLTMILFPEFNQNYIIYFYSATVYPIFLFLHEYLSSTTNNDSNENSIVSLLNERKIDKEKLEVFHQEKQCLEAALSKIEKTHEKTLHKLLKLQNTFNIQKQYMSNEQEISKQLHREKAELLQDQAKLKGEYTILKDKNRILHEKIIMLEKNLSIGKKQFFQTDKLNEKISTLLKKIESLFEENNFLKKTNQKLIHEKEELEGKIILLKKEIEPYRSRVKQNFELLKLDNEKIKSFLIDSHAYQKNFLKHIHILLDINERKITTFTKKLHEVRRSYLDLFTHLNKQLETAIESFSSCKKIHSAIAQTKDLPYHITQLIGNVNKLTEQLNEIKTKQESRKKSLICLISTCAVSREKLRLTMPGYYWIIKKKHDNELSFLLSNDTIAVGSFIVYLLCRQHSIPAVGFDEADLDLVTRLKPGDWQACYEKKGVQVIKLWSRNGIISCRALFKQRKIDIVFVEFNSSIDWITWLNQDVYSRPDNSLSVFYCIKYNDTIVACDPSGNGMLSLLRNSIHVLGNTKYAIQKNLLSHPARILRLANSTVKFGLTIDLCTFNAIKDPVFQRELAKQMYADWVVAKHKKYSSLTTGKRYCDILLKLDPKNTLFPMSYFMDHISQNKIDESLHERLHISNEKSHWVDSECIKGNETELWCSSGKSALRMYEEIDSITEDIDIFPTLDCQVSNEDKKDLESFEFSGYDSSSFCLSQNSKKFVSKQSFDDPKKYNDNDITDYKELIVKHQLGGFNILEDNAHQFLLSRKFIDKNDESKEYFLAVTDAVDTVGSSLPIDYFLDKSHQIRNPIAIVLSTIIIPLLNNLNKNQDNILLREQLKECLPETDYDDEFRENIFKKLKEANFDRERLQAIVQEAERQFQIQTRDVFEELTPEMLKIEVCYAKIVFPYNQTNVHWLSGEIKITKNNHDYAVEIYAHDPYGGGQMTASNFSTIKETIERRIRIEDLEATITCTNEISPYNRRQAERDAISCGIITAEDIIKLIQCQSLDIQYPYEYGALSLRAKHYEAFIVYEGDATAKERFSQRFEAAIKTIESQKETLAMIIHQPEDSSSKLSSGERDQLVDLISTLKNKDLKSRIIHAITNAESYDAKDGSYLILVRSAIEEMPVLLRSQNIEVDDKDIQAINQIQQMLFNKHIAEDIIYDLGSMLTAKKSESSVSEQRDDDSIQVSSSSSRYSFHRAALQKTKDDIVLKEGMINMQKIW